MEYSYQIIDSHNVQNNVRSVIKNRLALMSLNTYSVDSVSLKAHFTIRNTYAIYPDKRVIIDVIVRVPRDDPDVEGLCLCICPLDPPSLHI